MKIRWISTIIFIFTFLVVPVNGYGVDELPCQPDVVVMFGNGVWNDAEDADESRRRLQKRLEVHVLGTNLKGIIGNEFSSATSVEESRKISPHWCWVT